MANCIMATCRGCLSTERASMMYSLLEDDTRKLFSDCTRVKIPPDCKTETQLCAGCYDQCENWFAFKTTCWINDQRLSGQMDTKLLEESADESEDEIFNPYFEEITIESDEDLEFTTNQSTCSNYSIHSSPSTALIGPSPSREQESQKYLLSMVTIPKVEESRATKDLLNKDWKCLFCKKRHDSFADLRTHLIDQHINAKSPKCGMCSQAFATVQRAYIHLLKVHMSMLECPICNERQNSFSQFDIHMENEHQERGYGFWANETEISEDWDCPVCEAKFMQYTTFREHMKEVHLEKDNPLCPICESKPAGKIMMHIVKQHMNKMNCRMCPAKFQSIAAISDHIAKYHGEASSTTTQTAKRGNVDISDDDEDSDEGNFQPQKKMQKLWLKEELMTPEIQKPVAVKTEGRRSVPAKKPEMKKAVAVQPVVKKQVSGQTELIGDIPNGNWNCLTCKAPFRNYTDLRDHLQSVHIQKDKPICPICGSVKDRAINTVIHIIKVHMRKLTCPLCQFNCRSFQHFNEHAQVKHNTIGYNENRTYFMGLPHSKEQLRKGEVQKKLKNWFNWNCPVCHKKFDKCNDLRNHMYEKYLTKENPVCPICHMTLSEDVNAYRHILTVHMKKYNCPFCPKKLGSTHTFKQHLLEHDVNVD